MEEVISNEKEYYIVRTAPGKEAKFIDQIEQYLKKKEDHGIYSVFSPETVKGYIFVESISVTKLVDNLRAIPNFKGVIKTPVDFEELSKYFEKEGEAVVVSERDIVEIIAGPFKGDRARVVRTVPGKDEVVIEPINAPVPIPITLNIDDIRLIEESNKDEE